MTGNENALNSADTACAIAIQASEVALPSLVHSVICTASDDSCGGGLGTRLSSATVVL